MVDEIYFTAFVFSRFNVQLVTERLSPYKLPKKLQQLLCSGNIEVSVRIQKLPPFLCTVSKTTAALSKISLPQFCLVESISIQILGLYTCQLSRLRVENFDLTPAHACGPIYHA